jgi:quercetin dioxygenase-like cupin family protein
LSLDAGGRTGAAQYGGLQTLFVVEGSITVRAAGNPTRTLSAGEGTYEAPGTATQVFNPGRRRTMFLAFYVTAAGQPFSIPLDRSP